ncbi:MAG: hypothetical protein ABJZ55_17740 [Fuerstiella sp.]
MNQPTVLTAPVENEPPSEETVKSGWSKQTGSDDFNYISTSPWAPVALVMGIASLTALTNSVMGLALAFIAIVVSLVAVIRIRSERDIYRGFGMALCGLLLSTSCLVAGSWKLHYDYHHEVPEGYLRVNFPNEISDYEFVYYGNARRLHQKVAPFVGQKVFLKGYMYNLQKYEGLKDFVFLKDNGECCFGGEPKPFDMMVVSMPEGKTTKAFRSMIAVSGTLSADVTAGEGEPVYTIVADRVEEARTSF